MSNMKLMAIRMPERLISELKSELPTFQERRAMLGCLGSSFSDYIRFILEVRHGSKKSHRRKNGGK